MWVCLNDAFVSIVVDGQRPGNLLVRARRRRDLQCFVSPVGPMKLSVSAKTDYRYRVSVPMERVLDMMDTHVRNVDYGNFKDSVGDRELHAMYALWWGDHLKYQRDEGTR